MRAPRRARSLPWLGGLLVLGVACEGSDTAYVIDLDPPEDRAWAPHTGFTRAHYEAVFGRLCLGWVAHRTESGARVDLPRPGGWAEIEGVSRMLPAVGAWLADPQNPSTIEVDGEPINLVGLSVQTLVALSDRENPERWPRLQQGSQGNVEAAYVAEFLLQTRDRVWVHLSAEEREQLMQWLAPGEPDQELYTNNWNLFPAMRNVARRALGYAVDPAWTDHYLDLIEQEYLGDGWYGDGETRAVDWYNSFVLHPEMLFWSRWEGRRDPERSARIERRARAYLHHLPYLFAAEGRALPWGRSLAYRTAVVTPLAVARQVGLSPNDPGLDRRIVSGSLSYHMGGDVTSTDAMLTDQHVVPMGYLGEDFRVREGYISAGSTYFAARALQVLALPREHEFWTAVEQPLPAELGPVEHVMPAVALSVFAREPSEPLHLWNGRNQKSDATYSKLVYSTHFPFQRVAVDGSSAYDSALAVTPDGSTFWKRGPLYDAALAPGFVFNRSAFEYNRGFLTQVGLNADDLMVRASCVDPGVEADDRGIRVFEGAYPILVDPPPKELPPGGRVPDGVVLRSGGSERWEYARSSAGNVMIASLQGFDMSLPAHAFKGRDDLNFLHDHALQPALATRYPTQGPLCVASLHLARVARFDPEEIRARVESFELDEATRTMRVTLAGEPDGARPVQAWASLAPWADPVEVEVAGVRFTGPLRHARVEGDGRRLVAAGVRSIRGPDGALAFEAAAEPAGLVELDLDRGRITTDVPGRFGVAGVRAVAGRDLDGGWTDRTAEVSIDEAGLVLPPEVHRAHAEALELTTATFRLER